MSKINRVTRTRQQAKVTYNKLSRWYDLLAGGFEEGQRKAATRLLSPNEGDNLLEIGLGTGNSLGVLADLVGERCFYEIAKKKVDSGSALIRPEARTDKIQSEAYILSRKFGKKVHEALVDQDMLQAHRRSGG